MSFNFYFDPSTSVTINQTFVYGNQSATPAFVWFLFAFSSLAFLSGCFWLSLRTEKGEINTSRVGIALIAGILCEYTAYLSPVIDWTDGVTGGATGSFSNFTETFIGNATCNVVGNVTDNVTCNASYIIQGPGTVNNFYATSIHSLYQLPGATIIFIALGGFAFANLIYCLTRPEIILPDEGDLRGPIQAKTRAEGKGRKLDDAEEDVK